MCCKLLFRPLFITSFLLSGLAFISCNEDSAAKDHDEKDKAGFSLSCSVPVTVDLTGLNGCGIVLKLEKGKRLEPVLDSSLSGVKLIPGQKLL